MSTSHDVLTMLRRHYSPESKPPAGVLYPEVGSPCGRRRADAIWAPLVSSAGIGLVGHEIKVTRSDVLTELADPAKADPWQRFCTRWWLTVSDPALVDGLTLPESWGVLAPPSGRRTRTMTVLHPAPLLKPMEPAVAWRRLLARQALDEEGRMAYREVRVSAAEKRLAEDQQLLREQQHQSRRETGPEDEWSRMVLDKMKAVAAPHYLSDADAADALVEAASDLRNARMAARQVTAAAQQRARLLRNLVAPFGQALDELDHLATAMEDVA